MTNVTLRLPYLVGGYDGAFVEAEDQGYYKAVGLNVKVEQGRSSVLTTESVAQGNDTFGFADGSSVASLISTGAPVKVLADLTQLGSAGFIYNPGTKLSSVSDLKGKTLIANAAGGPTVQLLDAVLARAHIPASAMHINLVAAEAQATTFKVHPKDVLLGFCVDTYPAVLKIDPQAICTPYGQFGINVLSYGLITTLSEIQNHPQLVKGFVAASLKGWQFMTAHPNQTVAATIKAFPQANQFILLKSLQFALKLTHTPATQGKPLGWMASSDWKSSLNILHQYAGVKTIKPLSDYYTNQFIPNS